jgi:enamine deaminase RidA (YjgF/YER057c/UK114 family)
MTNRFIEVPGMREAYMATLTPIIPEYKPISIAHGVVSEGGKTLRMSGWPAIGPHGIIGKGDMRVQTLAAMDYVRQTVEAAGATWDDIVYLLFYFVDREKWWRDALPARTEFIQKHAKSGRSPCVTAIGVAGLMHPDMLIEVEAIAVFD